MISLFCTSRRRNEFAKDGLLSSTYSVVTYSLLCCMCCNKILLPKCLIWCLDLDFPCLMTLYDLSNFSLEVGCMQKRYFSLHKDCSILSFGYLTALGAFQHWMRLSLFDKLNQHWLFFWLKLIGIDFVDIKSKIHLMW